MKKLVVLSLLIPSLAFADDPPVEPAEPPAPTPAPAPEPTPAPVAPTVTTTPDLPAAKLEAKVDKPSKLPLELRPGGYVQFDSRRTLTEDEAHEMTIRRLRFKLDGGAGKYFKFRTLIDFAGSKVVVDDAWGEIVIAPEVSIRAGKDKSQFGIERLQSAAQLTFIERAFPTQLSPNRDIGAWLRGDIAKGLVHYAAGVVDGVADNAVIEGETDGTVEFNFHLLVQPLITRKELGELGIGAATTFGPTHGSLASPGLTNVRSASQATIVKYATGMDATATAVADGYRKRFAAHGFYYRGPAGILVEYVRDHEPILLMGSHTTVDDSAWQVAGSVALTPGDKPGYRGLKPAKPFDPSKHQYGAIELVGRISQLSLDDASFESSITGAGNSVQQATEVVLGANWYFNEWIKVQLDYSLTTFSPFESGADRPSEHLIATRLQAAI